MQVHCQIASPEVSLNLMERPPTVTMSFNPFCHAGAGGEAGRHGTAGGERAHSLASAIRYIDSVCGESFALRPIVFRLRAVWCSGTWARCALSETQVRPPGRL